tara:strand:+ start:3638 stop:4744 length:1107 start_codon:yes stop_codon:yes gene_type:complete
MATVYKTLLNNDMASTRTLLHEAIPLTGSLTSGTYGTFPNGDNIKNYAHGMFQSVYDYPYLSSSANHIFDLSVGYSSRSSVSGTTAVVMQDKKINMYTQMSQLLVGYNVTGGIKRFDEDGNFDDSSPRKDQECVFINFARLLEKDEIKKGSFSMTLGTGPYETAGTFGTRMIISDAGKENDYRVNSPAGEYAVLSAQSGYNTDGVTSAPAAGLIFYQAGVIVLSGSVFMSGTANGLTPGAGGLLTQSVNFNSSWGTFDDSLTGSSISGACNDFRHRIYDMSFNNTTELNSTIYFCRINHNDYNYSSNPTYLSQSQIVVKNTETDAPVSYFTTVGLYSADNELLAVAKLSEPLKKDPTNEMLLRVRLDY